MYNISKKASSSVALCEYAADDYTYINILYNILPSAVYHCVFTSNLTFEYKRDDEDDFL